MSFFVPPKEYRRDQTWFNIEQFSEKWRGRGGGSFKWPPRSPNSRYNSGIWIDCGKQRKMSDRTAGLRAKIRTQYIQNMKQGTTYSAVAY